MPPFTPMPLLRIPEPFDHPDFVFEPKMDGFRALAHIEGHHCSLVSRNGHLFKSWPQLAEEIAHAVRADEAILDGEIVCLDADGRSNFNNLLFRREWPFFCAFDLIALDGEDLRDLPLTERKQRLKRIMPRVESRLRFVDHIEGRGVDLFRLACERDLEGIVGKWRFGRYCSDGRTTSWVKVKNPDYSQMEGRHELFDARAGRRQRQRAQRAPELHLA
jgi:bifunctional non-homologous end joining protein LigD